MKGTYTSFLRVPRNYCVNDESFEILCEYLKKYQIKEITFFDCTIHSVHKVDFIKQFAESFKKRIPVLREMGIRTGINHLTTLGFFEQGGEMINSDLPYKITANGDVKTGSVCATDEKSIAYVNEIYTILAKADPDFIYIDDDMNLGYASGCYCEKCILKFESATGIFASCGMDLSRENLLKLFDNKEYQKQWIDFCTRVQSNIYATVEKAVHKVSEKIQLGMMTHTYPFLKDEFKQYATALKGNASSIRHRPGGGLWKESFDELLAKLSRIEGQILNAPEDVSAIEAELENFPSQSNVKSTRFTAFEAMSYLTVGCTGIAYNVLQFNSGGRLNDYEHIFETINNVDKWGEIYVSEFGRKPLSGVNLLAGISDEDSLVKKVHNLNAPNPFALLGIPVTYNAKESDVYIITKENAEILDDITLKKAFDKAVFMTGEALEILNMRGFQEYTGFVIEESFEKDCIEKDLESEFNYNGGKDRCVRDGCQAFWRMPEWTKAYSIHSSTDNAMYLTEIIDYADNVKGHSLAVGYNKFGKKVCVSGYYAIGFYDSVPRKYQLRKIFNWLSEETVKATVVSNHKIMLTQRELEDDALGITLCNYSLDDAEKIVVEVDGCCAPNVDFVYYDNGKIVTESTDVQIKEKSAQITVEKLPAISTGYFKVNAL